MHTEVGALHAARAPPGRLLALNETVWPDGPYQHILSN